MNSNRDDKVMNGETRVELKYCERCGGLGVRVAGSSVYCPKCLPEVAQLPPAKDPDGVGRMDEGSLLEPEDYEYEIFDFDAIELHASGGAA